MPYTITKRNAEYCVVKEDDGRVMGCHRTRSAAADQITALNITENKDAEFKRYTYNGVTVSATGRRSSSRDDKAYERTVRHDGREVTVHYADPDMPMRRTNDEARENFLSRHNCSNKKDPTAAGFWSCYDWANPEEKQMKKYEYRKMDDGRYGIMKMGDDELIKAYDTEAEAKAECDRMNKSDDEKALRAGRAVRWNWQGSPVYGRIDRIAREGTVTISGNSFDASDDNPVVVVDEMKPGADGNWQRTGQQVARRMDSLTELDDLPANKSGASEKAWFTKQFERLAKLLQPDPEPIQTSFKVVGDYWFGTWSNNFEDRDAEWFSADAIDDYVDRVDKGITPLPELWVWHTKGTRIGKAESIGTIRAENGGVSVFAVGKFDTTDHAQKAKRYYQRNAGYGMSHGFTYPDGALREGVYHSFNTYELSVLPLDVAANPYTQFKTEETKEMDEEKLAHLKRVFGDDKAEELVKQVERKTAAQAELTAFKDWSKTVSNQPTADVKTAIENAEANVKAVTEELMRDVTELAEAQMAVVNMLRDQQDTITKLRDAMQEMRDEMDMKPQRVDEDDSNAVDDDEMKAAARAKEANADAISQFFKFD